MGDWQVLDVCAAQTRMIAPLSGLEDGSLEASVSPATTRRPRSQTGDRRQAPGRRAGL